MANVNDFKVAVFKQVTLMDDFYVVTIWDLRA